ncbi:hypothetical protein LRP88_01540 [Fusarium phalaenopsidis]
MASVEVNILSIARVFDELSSLIERLLRNPKGKVDGDEQSITRFVLDDDFFYHVQTYVKTGMEFPDDEHLFEMVHPPTYFKTWLQKDRMWQGITTVSQHCRSSLNEAIYPIVGLSYHIAEYASSAVNIFEALLDPLRIISDHTIPFSSSEAEGARENINGILQLLQDNSRETSKRSTLVLKAIGIFSATILEDEVVLRALDELLRNRVPKDADTGDWEKQKALQTIHAILGKINTLASSSKAALAHISAMMKALADIHDALVMAETTAETMIRAVSLLSDQARPESAGYGVVGTKLEKAAGTCKQVVQLAREFAKQATPS